MRCTAAEFNEGLVDIDIVLMICYNINIYMSRQTPERPRAKENPPQNISVTPYEQDETLWRVVVVRSECDENGNPIMEPGWYATGYGYRDTDGKKERVIRCQKFVRDGNGEVYTLTKFLTEESLNEIQEEYSKRTREEREKQRRPGLPREVGRIACSESGVVAEPESPVEGHNSEAAVSDNNEKLDMHSDTGAAREDDAAAIEPFRENIGKEIEAIDNSLDMITESTSNSMAIMRRIQEMIQSFARYSAIRGVPSSLQSEKQHLEELRFRAQQLSADEGGRTARRELDTSGESLENEARRTGSRDKDVRSSLLLLRDKVSDLSMNVRRNDGAIQNLCHGLNILCYSIDYNDVYRYLSALKAVEERLNTAYRTGASIDDRVGEVRNYAHQIAERFSVAEFSE